MSSSLSTCSSRRSDDRSSALVMVLMAVVMISGLVVALLLVTRSERMSSRLALYHAQSKALADIAGGMAMDQLREATEDGMATNKMWISEPGRIRVYNNRANLTDFTDYDLFSALPGPDTSVRDQNNVDLNRPDYRGRYPIAQPAEGLSEATMKIGWINLSADPSAPFSKDNPIIGRIAYWVDDESCKININTADGSKKYTEESFGFGTPSEVSLQVLKNEDGQYLSSGEDPAAPENNEVSDIAAYAWDRGFNSVAELGQVPDLSAGVAEVNKFNLTHYSKTPELTFYGEPRMYLFPVMNLTGSTERRSHNMGAYYYAPFLPRSGFYPSNQERIVDSAPINFIYPTAAQLPQMRLVDLDGDGTKDARDLLQHTQSHYGKWSAILSTSSAAYPFLSRIAHAMKGIDSQGSAFTWPQFSGSAPGAFDAKYNDRQLDSIALSITDMATQAVSANQGPGYTYPSFLGKGMLSDEIVIGIGRAPKLTEIFFTFDAAAPTVDYNETPADPTDDVQVPALQVDWSAEFYLPETYVGADINCTDFKIGIEGGGHENALNQNDHNGRNNIHHTVSASRSVAAPVGGYWDDTFLRVVDAEIWTEPLAGIDLRAHNNTKPDPEYYLVPKNPDGTPQLPHLDFSKSEILHPFALGRGGSSFAHASVLFRSVLSAFALQLWGHRDTGQYRWSPGTYFGIQSLWRGAYSLYGNPTMLRPLVPDQFGVRGGVTVWTSDASGGYSWETVPLDSARNSKFTGEDPKLIANELKEAVVPVPEAFNIPIASFDSIWHARVGDPLVNKFPGDWISKKDPPEKEMTFDSGQRPKDYTDGHNPEYLPSGGGDPLSIWLPRQDVNYPKQSRFPSVGGLNYVRTGIIPDNNDDTSVSLTKKHGTPWRSINFSASSNASQNVAARYPDWAMLDLFTVPFTPQLPYLRGEAPTPKRLLTYGGATEGKINLNNPLIPYPFDQNISGVSQIPPQRIAPLEALFYGVSTSTSYSPSGGGTNPEAPIYTKVERDQAAKLRKAVQDDLAANGPFLLPGQLADVSAVNNFTYNGVAVEARSRNDLMRQVVGATTTQSNVYSIWVVAQTIQKLPGNTDYANYEPGDKITGETRRRYLVERHIDYGRDGVPGNAMAPGQDGVVGTADDPIDADYHPLMTYPLPYRWKVIAMENTAG